MQTLPHTRCARGAPLPTPGSGARAPRPPIARGDGARRSHDASPSAPRLAVAALLALSTLASAGCGKTMTKEECEKVGAHMRKVWDTEAAASAPEKGPTSERAGNVIKSEGDKMEAEWKAVCERELEGRKVDEQEVECFLAAKTVEEIQRCAAAKK